MNCILLYLKEKQKKIFYQDLIPYIKEQSLILGELQTIYQSHLALE